MQILEVCGIDTFKKCRFVWRLWFFTFMGSYDNCGCNKQCFVVSERLTHLTLCCWWLCQRCWEKKKEQVLFWIWVSSCQCAFYSPILPVSSCYWHTDLLTAVWSELYPCETDSFPHSLSCLIWFSNIQSNSHHYLQGDHVGIKLFNLENCWSKNETMKYYCIRSEAQLI